jgi:DNA-binding MarR family transcriptional regulator
MDPNTLRGEIMGRVGEHMATGSAAYVEDKDLAAAIGAPLIDVQRQIKILESNGLLEVVATFGPSYAVRLTPQGERALERASGPGPTPNNPIGF